MVDTKSDWGNWFVTNDFLEPMKTKLTNPPMSQLKVEWLLITVAGESEMYNYCCKKMLHKKDETDLHQYLDNNKMFA